MSLTAQKEIKATELEHSIREKLKKVINGKKNGSLNKIASFIFTMYFLFLYMAIKCYRVANHYSFSWALCNNFTVFLTNKFMTYL